LAAALAYTAIFSMSPLLVIALGVTEVVLGKEAARGELPHRLEALVGPRPAKAIEEILNNMHRTGRNDLYTAVGFAVFLFGASWVFVQLQDTLNTIWKVPRRAGVRWIVWMRGRLLLFVLVLGTGFLLLTLLAASVTLTALARFLEASWLSAGLLHGLNVGFSFVLVAFLFALIYKLLPEAHVPWRHAWVGGLGSSSLHSLGNYAIGLYLGYSPPTSVFGAASSVIVIMLWVYYSSLSFLLGAEYVHVLGEEAKASDAELAFHTGKAVPISSGQPQAGRRADNGQRHPPREPEWNRGQ
jgi:membrane protein